MIRRLGTIDLDTGEVLTEGIPIWIGRKPRINNGWFMAFQDAFEILSKDRELTGEANRVLLYLFSRLDFDNFIQVQQSDIAQALDLKKQNVNRCIRILSKKEIILKGPKIGRSSSFRLNPNFGWKGKVSSLREAQREHLKLVK